MKPSRDAGLAVCAALLLATSWADAGDRVVVVADPESPVTARLRAELGELGFSVDEVAQSPELGPDDLERCAREHGALATIMLVGKGRVSEIWIADRATDKTVLRRIPGDDAGGAGDAAVTKTVELLRASLLEVRVHEPKAPLPPAADRLVGAAKKEEPDAPVATVRIAPSIAFRGGGLPPTAQVALDVLGWMDELFAAGVSLSIPTFPAVFEVPRGEMSRTQFWADAVFELHPYRGVIDPRAGAGLGLEISGADGDADAPYQSASGTTVAALGLVELGISVPVGQTIALDSFVECGITLPRIDYRVTGSTAATAGWPACTAGLGGAASF